MKFYSTKNKKKAYSFREAVIKGLPEDNGLFMPERFPQLSESFFEEIKELSIAEIAYRVILPYVSEDIPEADLKLICDKAFNFEVPLVNVKKDFYSMELYHGPTMAFKDFGARFMAGCLGYFSKDSDKEVNILAATSGDTGGAVAAGFYKTPGVSVTILYPKGKVSELQERQLTTLGENISAVEIDGTFDDCQKLVKKAFLDEELNARVNLSSANSINVARLLPQSVYYFYAWSRLASEDRKIAFAVPSGNFGNITGGLFAKMMGLKVENFIAATNLNKIVPDYLKQGQFMPKPSIQTVSNAMDVGNPSNFDRLMSIFNKNWQLARQVVKGYYYTDEETLEAIGHVYRKYGYILDPHGAVGYKALTTYMDGRPSVTGVLLETAHPIKFADHVEESIGKKLEEPEGIKDLYSRNIDKIPMKNSYDKFKEYLIEKATVEG
ncbi:threonine synthase [Marinigracilibium pacificum]|uniref:Threonine synthase n=1 Tax=Marinigracilibium pacificum TaxID=2729599 RepID=A0A848J4K0_9BACT|nr:threonine synthase [Marinigracilibium pacificum]NMM50646.1 threonine synthase [Marinigracilibium pacificum]